MEPDHPNPLRPLHVELIDLTTGTLVLSLADHVVDAISDEAPCAASRPEPPGDAKGDDRRTIGPRRRTCAAHRPCNP